ncbi:MAG: hypothetical protein V1862_10225, partial [Methanobacteriota archaeon]
DLIPTTMSDGNQIFVWPQDKTELFTNGQKITIQLNPANLPTQFNVSENIISKKVLLETTLNCPIC